MEKVESNELKPCPYCGELILAVAIKCKHCGSKLEDYAEHESQSTASQSDTIGYMLLIIPFVAIMLMWFWVGSMNIFQNPRSVLQLIIVITILITAILSSYEASKLGMKKKGREKTILETGPLGYFFAISLLWVISYPIYLFNRSKYGCKNLLVGGIIIVIIFVLVGFILDMSISSQIERIRNLFR